MWHKNIAGRVFGLVTRHACDRRRDRQNYNSQDRASIAASHGKNTSMDNKMKLRQCIIARLPTLNKKYDRKGKPTSTCKIQYGSGLKDWILSCRSTQKPRVGVWHGPNEMSRLSRSPYLPCKIRPRNTATSSSLLTNSYITSPMWISEMFNCAHSTRNCHTQTQILFNWPSLLELYQVRLVP